MRKNIIYLFFLFVSYNTVMSQTTTKFSLNKVTATTKITFQNSARTHIENGFSVLYSIHGFAAISDIGQIGLNYKKGKNSYYLLSGIGSLVAGINQSILNSNLHINGNLGIIFADREPLYSLGLSYNYLLNTNSQLELNADVFSHPGSSYQYSTVNAYYTHGVIGATTYSHNILNDFTASVTIGIAYMEYRYAEYYVSGNEQEIICYYKYISRNEENGNSVNSLKTIEWKKQPISFPFDITISYKF